jgi:3-hydroxyisobutyrate dehydrogenase-like beta-hydroxyacid dehydrogenase
MSEVSKDISSGRAARSLAVAVLYPGELGVAFAAMLQARGMRVVTTLADRRESTSRRCREGGIEVLATLEQVVEQANVVISLVPPAAAEDVVDAYCKLIHLAPPGALFVDANSIGPEMAANLATKVEACGVGFVDAAINGLAKNLRTSGTLYLSGARASEVASLVGDGMRMRMLPGGAGRASAMKMLLAGLSKGICALYTELALLAQRQEMQGEFAEAISKIYPGISALVERMLPTYALHAARRVTEMQELEQTSRWMGLEPCVIAAVRSVHENLAGVSFDAAAAQSAAALIEKLAEEQMLAADLTAAQDVSISVFGSK